MWYLSVSQPFPSHWLVTNFVRRTTTPKVHQGWYLCPNNLSYGDRQPITAAPSVRELRVEDSLIETSTSVHCWHFHVSNERLCVSCQHVSGVASIIFEPGCLATSEVAHCPPCRRRCLQGTSKLRRLHGSVDTPICIHTKVHHSSTLDSIVFFRRWARHCWIRTFGEEQAIRTYFWSPSFYLFCVHTGCVANHRTLVEPFPTTRLRAACRHTSANHEAPEIRESLAVMIF